MKCTVCKTVLSNLHHELFSFQLFEIHFLRKKTSCIQNHLQTFLFIFRAKAPALIHGKSLHGHWHVRRKIPKPFFPAPHRTKCWKEAGFSKDTYVSVDLIMSSGPAGKVSRWALQSNFSISFAFRTSHSKCDYEKHHLHSHCSCILLFYSPESGKYPQKWVLL